MSSSQCSSTGSGSRAGSRSSGHPAPEQRQRQKAAAALQAAGWSRQEVLNVPNALSLARLLSGPLIASWILDGQWALALPALAVSGASDWADGWAARRFNQPSVIGSYLDPLADKVLICSVVGALGWSGAMPPAVVGVIVGRDVILVAGAFVARAKSLGWRWPGLSEFFRVGPPPAAAATADAAGAAGAAGAAAGSATAEQQTTADAAVAAPGGGGGRPAAPSGSTHAHAAPLVKPLYISKVNTCFQLGLVGACIGHAWLGVPSEEWIWGGSYLTAGTTVASCLAYFKAYLDGKVLAPGGGR
ncbi:cardiolipin mitochondrial [Chlorella sorokiniana]|uniref:Cardiolipin mitochondrial n=1 Tax=Chlorella sorokiniana TaxID=3076 RepID=A0A2P6TU98_CHLSO|nr:cardiolipin mitochondrial [Chlorella sorokiniana]|eukprot:PRW57647.1 cardiolipin mitochondrial [Chlorella sorokiniana]